MTDYSCPLCKSRNSEPVEFLETTALATVYKAKFGVQTRFASSQLTYSRCLQCGLRYFVPSESGDAALYEQLQRFDWYYMDEKWEYDYAARHILPEDRVLEVGAGRAAFAKHVGNGRYTGLEYNDKAIEKAASKNIQLVKQSVEEHARRGNQYDVVVSFQVLEHVPDPDGFIGACVACLRPGGKLIISVPAHDGFAETAINHVLDMPPHHVSHWSKAVMEYLPTRYGLEIVGIMHEPLARYHINWAKRIKVESILRNRFGLPWKLLDVSWPGHLIALLSVVVARLLPITVRGDLGHTIAAVYRKP